MKNKSCLADIQGKHRLPRIRDPGRSHLPLLTRTPSGPGAKVPAPTSILLAMPWACYPEGAAILAPGSSREDEKDVGCAGRDGRWGGGGK